MPWATLLSQDPRPSWAWVSQHRIVYMFLEHGRLIFIVGGGGGGLVTKYFL